MYMACDAPTQGCLIGSGPNAQPLHLIDVTSWVNNIGGLMVYSKPVYTMVTDADGNVSFAVASIQSLS